MYLRVTSSNESRREAGWFFDTTGASVPPLREPSGHQGVCLSVSFSLSIVNERYRFNDAIVTDHAATTAPSNLDRNNFCVARFVSLFLRRRALDTHRCDVCAPRVYARGLSREVQLAEVKVRCMRPRAHVVCRLDGRIAQRYRGLI